MASDSPPSPSPPPLPVPPSSVSTSATSWIFGRVTKVVRDKRFGSIAPTTQLPLGAARSWVHFYMSDANWEVQENDVVKFKLSEKNPGYPSAKIVRRVEEREDSNAEHDRRHRFTSQERRTRSTSASRSSNIRLASIPKNFGKSYKAGASSGRGRRTSNMLRGKIVKTTPTEIFLEREMSRSQNQNPEETEDQGLYKAKPNTIVSGHLSVEVGDEVMFSQSFANKSNFVLNVQLTKCSRNNQQLEDYLMSFVSKIETGVDESSKRFVVSAVTCAAVWDCIGHCNNLSIMVIATLNHILVELNEKFPLKENLRTMLETLLKTPLFVQQNSLYSQYIQQVIIPQISEVATEDFCKVMLMMSKHVPAKRQCIVRNIEPLASSGQFSEFLYTMLKQVTSTADGDIQDLTWDNLPLVPTVDELLSGSLSSETRLRPVNEVGRYDSADDYVDIYFRLLRSDCFSALSKGANDLLKGTLNNRDMNVYTNVTMAGFLITHYGNGSAIGLRFAPIRPVENWEHSSCLMYGNLLCISVSGSFRDPIWATVVNRELLPSAKIVMVELCSESNTMSDSEAILSLYLAGSRSVMIESPTYYRAYQPVLKSLQSIDPTQLSFQEELVNCQPELGPYCTQDTTTFDAGVLFKRSCGVQANILEYCKRGTCSKLDNYGDGLDILDPSQQIALRQCLINRIGMIQGPPGTGKTFIGIKLIQVLLSLSRPPQSPILILTYKNHSLDEFLKELLQHFPNDVARVGGRSSEESLAKCNIAELKKSKKMHQDIYQEIMKFKGEISTMREQINDTFEELNANRYFDRNYLIDSLSDEQLKVFLLQCPWSRCGKLKLATDNDTEWKKVSGKVSPDDISDLLRKCEDVPLKVALRLRNATGSNLKRLLDAAIKQWMPTLSEFETLNSTFSPGIGINPDRTENVNIEAKPAKVPEGGDTDEKDAEEAMKERMAAANHKMMTRDNLLKNMKMFEEKKGSEAIRLMECSRLISTQVTSVTILGITNMWDLNRIDRAKLVQCIMLREYDNIGDKFQELLEFLQKLTRSKEELENQHKANILSLRKIVGMTVTGANINHQLVAQIKPEVILVEEAAEVLEPQIISLLGNWTKHLILIGDHKQLRPSVENYTLCREYHLDLSMMERLINNKLPFASLELQNRMRPEFAELLLDIYPRLKSNHERVSRNAPTKCLGSSLFFWNHTDPETSDRSFSNDKEAARAVKLALFLVQQDCRPDQITILSPYLGQVRLLRGMMKEIEDSNPELFKTQDSIFVVQANSEKEENASKNDPKVETKKSIRIQTIDMYQGDENDFVIVSLVRSNDKGKMGFVDVLNRRCVAQSRSRCGLYFIGNRETLSKGKNWMHILEKLDANGLIGDALPLQCASHPTSKVFARSSDDIPNSAQFCKVPCDKFMECKKHKCETLCHIPHSHFCKVVIDFHFSLCGHPGKKKCSENEGQCQTAVYFKYENCGHSGERKCFQKAVGLLCQQPCGRILKKCKHPCRLTCGKSCTSEPCTICREIEEKEEESRKRRIEEKRQEIFKMIDEEIERTSARAAIFERTRLSKDGDSAAEYFSIEDKVMKYIRPEHKWFPQVTQIEKVTNPKLELKWLKVKREMVDPFHAEMKFHGTSDEAVDSIIQHGFKLPADKHQMFGRGIYFATDSSKSAQKIYTKNSGMLLVCEVLLGKCWTVDSRQPSMDLKTLQGMGYDSLFAKRGTQSQGGVLNDEFVIYNPKQAIVRYIVSYKETEYSVLTFGTAVACPQVATRAGTFTKYSIQPPKRSVDINNPLEYHFRVAESQFLRLIGRHAQLQGATVDCVDYYKNSVLEDRFDQMQIELKKKYPIGEESECILAFHGTKPENIDSIVRNNFDVGRLSTGSGDPGYFGAGIYFSEFPSTSIQYGKLLLCRVLPGKTYVCMGLMMGVSLKSGYDSHGYKPDKDGRCNELVIFNADQILPCYVISFACT